MISIFLFAVFIVLQVADAVLTYQAISSGKGKEAWPPVRILMEWIGLVPGLVLCKGVLVVLLIAAQVFYPSIYLDYVVSIYVCVYTLIIVNNYKISSKAD